MKPRFFIFVPLLIGFLLAIAIPQLSNGDRRDEHYKAEREKMVATQMGWHTVRAGRIGVKDKRVLEAMRRVLRH